MEQIADAGVVDTIRGRRWSTLAARILSAVVLLATVACGAADPEVVTPTGGGTPAAAGDRVLVFFKTADYEHASIPHAIGVIEDLGQANGFEVDATEDATRFTTDNLLRYRAVVWLSTTADVLDDTQQAAFETYIHRGGGYVGIHAATDTEYTWPWYGRLVGAWFKDHPTGTRSATVVVTDRAHPSTASLPTRWTRTDEWYNFRTNPRAAGAHVLATLDESTYEGGTMGGDHPIAWCQPFEGGRSWYTAGGHDASAFDEDDFALHLLGGIRWAAGMVAGDCGPGTPPPILPVPTTPGPTTPGPTTPGPTTPGPATPDGPVGPDSSTTARFVPVTPTRLLDTRTGVGAPPGPVPSDATLEVPIAGATTGAPAGAALPGEPVVPAAAVAVALNVTATEAAGAGYVTAWPAGRARPLSSTLNVERPGQTIAGAAMVGVGEGGRVALYAQTTTHLVVDVTGYWVASGPAAGGRFVAVEPARLLDTRGGVGAPVAPVDDDGVLTVAVAGRGGVPAHGAAAVVVNLTATEAGGAGFVTLWPDGPRPLVSNLNVDGPSQTIANLAVVPLGADGSLRLSAQRRTHLLLDVTGWLTDDTAPVAADGLFVPVIPARLMDSRTAPPGTISFGAAGVAGGATVELQVAGVGPLPSGGMAAVVATVTATDPTAPGYVTVFAAGSSPPHASNLNVTVAGQTIANLAVGSLGPTGRLALFAQESLDLVVDATGYFTAAA